MFKRCPSCGFEWSERKELLSDRSIELIGYQINFKRLEAGLILFNHSCRGTLALCAGDFSDLYRGPVFEKRAAGTDQCPGHCLHEEDFRPCPAECECSYVRDIIDKINRWPKTPAADATSEG